MVIRNYCAKFRKGFTLLELLIVISIIGILVAVATASYTSSQQKARNSRRMSDMKAVQNAAEQYYSMNSSVYPSATNTFNSGANATLPQGFPSDPKPAPYDAYTYNTTIVSGSVVGYCACATMEGVTSGNATATTCAAGTWAAGPYFCVTNLQ